MLEYKNIKAYYGDKVVLDGLNLTFEKNKLHVIIGPNGSGKSTLCSLLGVAKAKYQGDIYLDKLLINSYQPQAKALKLSFLPQRLPKIDFSVKTLLKYGRYPYHNSFTTNQLSDEQLIADVVTKLELTPYLDTLVSNLSGGEMQRALLGLLMVQDSDLVVLDEPFTYLDINHQLRLASYLQDLVKQGKSVIVVMHDLLQALSFADEITLLDQGQLKFQGNSEALIQANVLAEVFKVKVIKLGNYYVYEGKQ